MTPTLPTRLRRLIPGVCLCLVLAPGLGTAGSKPVRQPAPAPAPIPALPMRLSPDVVPQAYALSLTLDPAQRQGIGLGPDVGAQAHRQRRDRCGCWRGLPHGFTPCRAQPWGQDQAEAEDRKSVV